MKVAVKPIVIDELGMVPKDSKEKAEEIENGKRIETIPTTVSLREARILRSVLEI